MLDVSNVELAGLNISDVELGFVWVMLVVGISEVELWYVGLVFGSPVVDISEVELEMSDVKLKVLESPVDEVKYDWSVVLNSVLVLEMSDVELAVLDVSVVDIVDDCNVRLVLGFSELDIVSVSVVVITDVDIVETVDVSPSTMILTSSVL